MPKDRWCVIEELSAVNLILRAVGAQPVSALESGDVNSARAQENLKEQRRSVLKKGFIFNTAKIDLAVQSSNSRVRVAQNYLRYIWPSKELTYRVDSTDSQWYVWNTANNDWHDKVVKDFEYVFDITNFREIPEHFGEWIAYEAAFQFYNQLNEDTRQVPLWIGAKLVKARADALNSLPAQDMNVSTGYAARRGLGRGSGSVINVGGERIRI